MRSLFYLSASVLVVLAGVWAQLFVAQDFSRLPLKKLLNPNLISAAYSDSKTIKQNLDISNPNPVENEVTITCDDGCFFTFEDRKNDNILTVPAYSDNNLDTSIVAVPHYFIDWQRRLIGYEAHYEKDGDFQDRKFFVYEFDLPKETGLHQSIALELPSLKVQYDGYDYNQGQIVFSSQNQNNNQSFTYIYAVKSPSLLLQPQ